MTALTLPDVKLNYQLIGADPGDGSVPVVMIHGLGANLSFWFLGAVRYLGRDRPMLLPDLRGHGASSMPVEGYTLGHLANDMLSVMDAAGIERAHLVGHSHGGRVALVMAQRAPDRFESLTIADTQLRALQPPMRLCDWAHWPAWKAELQREGVTSFPPETPRSISASWPPSVRGAAFRLREVPLRLAAPGCADAVHAALVAGPGWPLRQAATTPPRRSVRDAASTCGPARWARAARNAGRRWSPIPPRSPKWMTKPPSTFRPSPN